MRTTAKSRRAARAFREQVVYDTIVARDLVLHEACRLTRGTNERWTDTKSLVLGLSDAISAACGERSVYDGYVVHAVANALHHLYMEGTVEVRYAGASDRTEVSAH